VSIGRHWSSPIDDSAVNSNNGQQLAVPTLRHIRSFQFRRHRLQLILLIPRNTILYHIVGFPLQRHQPHHR
jgi:hypothetical protein